VLLAVLVAAPALVAAPPRDDLARTRLDRAAFTALPAVVRVQARIPVPAITSGGRRIPLRQPPVTITGTGFAVGPNHIVIARHVALPSDDAILRALRSRPSVRLAGLTAPRIARGRVTHTVMRADTEASAASGGPVPRPEPAQVVATSREEVNDLAVLRIAVPGPYLRLSGGRTAGTRIALVGYGGRRSVVPAIRDGRIDVQAIPDDGPQGTLMSLDAEVLEGDSGAPVIAEDGLVHGVVIRRRDGVHPPIATGTGAITEMIRVPSGDDAGSIDGFGRAMEAFWDRDHGLAAERLDALRRTWPDSRLIRHEHARADALARAEFTPDTRPGLLRGPLIVVSLASLLAALVLLVIRWRNSGA